MLRAFSIQERAPALPPVNHSSPRFSRETGFEVSNEKRADNCAGDH